MTVLRYRHRRVGEQIREEISALLVSGLKDPRIGFATITEVRVSPDLHHASVYVSVLGSSAEQEQALEGFHRACAFIRRTLAHNLSMRRMPELKFELDRSAEYAAHIEELLRQNAPPPGDAAAASGNGENNGVEEEETT